MKKYKYYKVVGIISSNNKPFAVICKSPLRIIERASIANLYGSDDHENWEFLCAKERYCEPKGIEDLKEVLGDDFESCRIEV